MNRNTYVDNENNSYLSQIILAQNRIRSKLPFYGTYSPEEHFNYLSGSRQLIERQKLMELIPFKNEYSEFSPLQHLDSVICSLNQNVFLGNNQNKDIKMPAKQSGLSFRGYMRLILVERMIGNQFSEVNKTFVNKFSILNRIDSSKKDQANVRIGIDFGMLLFLQCLKQSMRQLKIQQNNCESQAHLNNHITFRNTNQIQSQFNLLRNRDSLPTNNNFDFYSREKGAVSCECILPGENPEKGDLIPFKRKQIFDKTRLSRSNQTQIIGGTSGKNQEKPWISETKTKDSEFKKEEEMLNGVLGNFSSEKNLWKNFSDLNYQGRSEINKRNTWGSAFIEESFISSTPRVNVRANNQRDSVYQRLASKKKL